jgi:long-chain-alcohol oxidase
MALSAKEQSVFAVVADALLPALDGHPPGRVPAGSSAVTRFWSASATDLGIAARLRDQVERLPDDRSRDAIASLLRNMDSRVGGLVLYGRPRSFRALDPAAAAFALARMAGSRLALRRSAFQALKRLVAITAVTAADDETTSPIWRDIGYPGPDDTDPAPDGPVAIASVERPSIWDADVVVIGSGAGGGTAAAVLAGAGLDVVVLEKGPYVRPSDLSHLEHDAYRRMYLDGNLAPTADLGIGMQAGSCLGGGTEVNYTVSLPTPDHVREEWDRIAGFDDVFTGGDYAESVRAVQERLGVNERHGRPSGQEALMVAGLTKLGWHVSDVPRNVVGCPQDEACGYCSMGCRRGRTQSVLRTWLEDASMAGARIVTEAEATRVTLEAGRATGVTASVRGVPLTIRARAVVVAAGGLYTPVLLRRSAVGGRALGRTLWLHPTTAVWGRFSTDVRPWTGTVHSKYGTEFADQDGDRYGTTFEVGPSHPVVAALAFGWRTGRQYKSALLEYPRWSAIGVRLRDHDHGRVEVPKRGRPIWHYRMSKRDQAHVRRGIRGAAEALAAAGAQEVMTTSGVPVTWEPGSHDTIDAFMDRVDGVGYDSNGILYASYHQMGSARMGSDPRASVVDEDCQLHGCAGVYVMDASAFPATSGVNPMVTIEALAHRAAQGLAARLSRPI